MHLSCFRNGIYGAAFVLERSLALRVLSGSHLLVLFPGVHARDVTVVAPGRRQYGC
jgi:hypothetical protein